MSQKKLIFVLLLFISFVFSGCAEKSITHLGHGEWDTGNAGKVCMQFLNFDYQVVKRNEGYGVKGVAHVNKKNIPFWANEITQLEIHGYISDSDGQILADNVQVFSPSKIEFEKGVPFDFELTPDSHDENMVISFGYLMRVCDDSSKAEPKSFMAIEDAVLR